MTRDEATNRVYSLEDKIVNLHGDNVAFWPPDILVRYNLLDAFDDSSGDIPNLPHEDWDYREQEKRLAVWWGSPLPLRYYRPLFWLENTLAVQNPL